MPLLLEKHWVTHWRYPIILNYIRANTPNTAQNEVYKYKGLVINSHGHIETMDNLEETGYWKRLQYAYGFQAFPRYMYKFS